MKAINKIAITNLCAAFAMAASLSSYAADTPKLVVEIVVDQLRGDMPTLVESRLQKRGLKFFMNQGTWYKNAHHAHANTETIVGHTTLATGADPAKHGLVANVWFDDDLDRLVYNIEDAKYTATQGMAGRDKENEIDPTQVARSDGRSPDSILTSTFSDELYVRFGEKSKVFAVAGKDRAAVAMAGHSGKAFWFSTANGQITSSTYYYDDFPKWAADWNALGKADAYSNTSWALLYDQDNYVKANLDDRPYENPADLGFGKTFPHPYGAAGDNKYFYTVLMASPAVDELTADFAKQLIANEQLGQDAIPDYLSVGLSATDYVGHLFGPSSLESEDNLLRLDKTLEDLISYIDKTVGIKNTLFVLSADHGAPDASEYANTLGFKSERLNLQSLNSDNLQAMLNKQFQLSGEVIKKIYHPYIYLDHALIQAKGLDTTAVADAVAEHVGKHRGIAHAIATHNLAIPTLSDSDAVMQSVLKNYHAERSGDVHLVYMPQWVVTADKDPAVSHHGSPWRYDSHVPIMMAGWNIPKQHIVRKVNTTAIAPTLSVMLGTKIPSGSDGIVLKEVARKK